MYVTTGIYTLFILNVAYIRTDEHTVACLNQLNDETEYLSMLGTLAEAVDLSLQACLAALQLCLLTHQAQVGSLHSLHLCKSTTTSEHADRATVTK